MNRNTNSHFALNPTRIDMSRSTFKRDSSHKTTFNVGDLIPFYVDEVLPGDTFKVRTSKVVRMQTLLTPVMDNIYLDTYYFFVPNRIVWQHWRELMGENNESAWIPQTEYQVPQITAPSDGWSIGTIADYMGIPTGVAGLSVNALPIRAYALICNEWFRDENLTDPLNVPVDDTTVVGVKHSTLISRKLSKKRVCLLDNIQDTSISVRQLSNITIKSLYSLHNISLAILITLEQHMDINTIPMALNVAVQILLTGLTNFNSAITIVRTSIESFLTTSRICQKALTVSKLTSERYFLHNSPHSTLEASQICTGNSSFLITPVSVSKEPIRYSA